MNRLGFVIWSSALNVQWCYRFRMCILLSVIKNLLKNTVKFYETWCLSYTVQTLTVTQTSDYARSNDCILKL